MSAAEGHDGQPSKANDHQTSFHRRHPGLDGRRNPSLASQLRLTVREPSYFPYEPSLRGHGDGSRPRFAQASMKRSTYHYDNIAGHMP